MNDVSVPIDKAGRIVLPKSVRDELAINPGDHLKISTHGNEVTLRPTKEKSGFTRRGRALIFSSEEADLLTNEAVEIVRADEHGRTLNNLTEELSPPSRK